MQRLGRNIVTTEQNGSSSTTIRKHAIKIPSRFLEIIAIRDQNMGEKGGEKSADGQRKQASRSTRNEAQGTAGRNDAKEHGQREPSRRG